MITCLYSTKNYEDDIISVWQECFGDNEDYIQFFLKNCPDKICIADVEGDSIVSFLFLLEGKIDNLKAKYIYAAATKSDFRRQGIMQKLIIFSKQYCIEKKYDVIFLVPGNNELYKYYEKSGFSSYFEKLNVKFSKNDINSNIFRDENNCNNILSLRKNLLENIKAFSFNDSIFNYTLAEHSLNSGKLMAVNTNEEQGYALYYEDGKNIVVKELLSSKGLNSSVIGMLFEKYNVENVYIHCPLVYNTKDIEVVCTKCGMACALNNGAHQYLTKGQPFYAAMYLD